MNSFSDEDHFAAQRFAIDLRESFAEELRTLSTPHDLVDDPAKRLSEMDRVIREVSTRTNGTPRLPRMFIDPLGGFHIQTDALSPKVTCVYQGDVPRERPDCHNALIHLNGRKTMTRVRASILDSDCSWTILTLPGRVFRRTDEGLRLVRSDILHLAPVVGRQKQLHLLGQPLPIVVDGKIAESTGTNAEKNQRKETVALLTYETLAPFDQVWPRKQLALDDAKRSLIARERANAFIKSAMGSIQSWQGFVANRKLFIYAEYDPKFKTLSASWIAARASKAERAQTSSVSGVESTEHAGFITTTLHENLSSGKASEIPYLLKCAKSEITAPTTSRAENMAPTTEAPAREPSQPVAI